MTQLLFEGTTIAVLLNGGKTKSFSVGRGVIQGCPLAPYLFLFVGQALHSTLSVAKMAELLSGINLPNSNH
jgi:hypothetical protein